MTNKEAIEILESIKEINEVDPAMIDNNDCIALDMAIEALKNERPHGKWTEHQDCFDDTYYTCSHCGEDWTTIEGNPTDNLMNYCPMCGADMREADKCIM